MANLQYYDIILKPVITERSMNDMEHKKYTFHVHPNSTKKQIKKAVEEMFDGVEVERVNTMNLSGKTKRRGLSVGKTAKVKKAIVKLTEASEDIDFFQGM